MLAFVKIRAPMLRPAPVTLIRAGDAERAGLRLASDPAMTRVRTGVYTPTRDWQPLPPWDRYLARVHAYALVSPDAVFALESAAALFGLPLFGEPRQIHLFDPARAKSVRYGDVSVHTSVDGRGVSRLVSAGSPGILATSMYDTVVDLARVLPPAQALALVDMAISARAPLQCSIAELAALAAGQSGRRGLVQLGWLWERADAASESVGESLSRIVIEWCGFELPELQEAFRWEGETDRADFFWRRLRIAGESDGYGKYDADDVTSTKAHFVKEKRREDRMRRHLNGFARWDMRDALRVGPLREKLQVAGVPIVRSPQPAMLATLARSPRSLPALRRSPTGET